MIAPALSPFLRVPPFPGSRPLPMARAAALGVCGDDDLDRAIEGLAQARVGGDYWGLQPALPALPYTLIRVRDAERRSALMRSMPVDKPLLLWVDGPSAADDAGAAAVVSGPCDPWHLVSRATEIVVDPHDELILIAGLAGIASRFPDSGGTVAKGPEGPALRQMVRDRIEQFTYSSPFTGEPLSLTEAIALCAHWRTLIDGNRPITAAIGFAPWKRSTAAPLLWAGADVPFVSSPRDIARGDQIAAWKSRVPAATLAMLEGRGAQFIEVEDGFIRSIGLGADCVPPLSLVVDPVGIFFDPRQPSELEQLIQNGGFARDLLDRARRLRSLIVEMGVSKYGVSQQSVARRAGERRHVLVPGQVEDDRSVTCGGGSVRSNLELLRRVRGNAPDAYIIYKPHPDVEAGHRVGIVRQSDAAALADEVVRDVPISALINMVDEVHVNTSLAGFEALLRNTPVTTYGVPFYAGWGLTRDLGSVPHRRTGKRTLDELVAAVLLLYPRYLDPFTGLPCTPEILLQRLAQGSGMREGPLVSLRRLQGYLKWRLSSLRLW